MPEDVPLIDVLVTNGNLHACLTTRQPTARQALAVGGVDQADEGSSDSEEDDNGEFAIIDGGAGDNLLNFDRDCWGNDYRRDNKQSWGTAKQGERIRAVGAGTISIIVEASNKKKFAMQLYAYHVPQIAMNLISVYTWLRRRTRLALHLHQGRRLSSNVLVEVVCGRCHSS
jgi:hypothetical protein